MTRSLFLAGLALAGVCVVGCGRSARTYQTSAGAVAAEGAITVRVQNENFADMNVYVVSEGLATRLGTVTGLTSSTFTLDPSFAPSSELRIVATPIGGNGRASSGALVVQPGQTIDFRIASILRQSSASVH